MRKKVVIEKAPAVTGACELADQVLLQYDELLGLDFLSATY